MAFHVCLEGTKVCSGKEDAALLSGEVAAGAGQEIPAQILLPERVEASSSVHPVQHGLRWMPEPLSVPERCFFPVLSSSCPPMDSKYVGSPPILCAKSPKSPGYREGEKLK